MSAQHTPGPWIEGVMGHDMDMDGVTNGEWVPIGIADEEGFAGCVALAHPSNARLIAAAPALLEALEGLLETSAIKWRDYHDDTAVRSARAAIRAAKGESNAV